MVFPVPSFTLDPSQPTSDPNAKFFRSPTELGPLLRFADISDNCWQGSVLVIAPIGSEPHFEVSIGSWKTLLIDSFGSFSFYRFDLVIVLTHQPQHVSYKVTSSFKTHSHSFHVPSVSESARFTFWSCNGFGGLHPHEKYETSSVWNDLLKNHERRPYHIQIGGGDQIYADGPHMDLFNLPLLNEFMETADLKDREKVEWTLEHEKTVSERYFCGYAHWFQEEGFAEALATIPYTFVCDDHDIFDGYGSYPAAQQGSPVIQNIGRIGYRFYLLFQHHTTFQRAFQDSLFPENKGYNWIKQFGSNTLVLALDNRSSRTEHTVINEDCWTSIWNTLETRLQDSPTPIRHLYIVATVPVVYPRLLAVDNAMEAISNLQSVGRKVFGPLIKCILPEKEEKVFLGGVGHGAVMHRLRGSFGQPDLRDDLMDEWTHPNHLEERNRMVERLQQIAEEKRVRVTFLSGDVHICGVGRFRTEGSDVVPDLLGENVRMDYKAMYQVISSAIVNSPGPDLVVSLLHSNPRVLSPKVTKLPNTVEEMFELFEKDVDGKVLKHKRLLPRRNWSCFETQENGSYKVEIHVENMNHAEESVVYGFSIPELV